MKLYLCSFVVFIAFAVQPAWAVNYSAKELRAMEEQMKLQNLEHKKLQAQATQINLELTSVNRKMIDAAKKIQQNERQLSQMELELEKLKEDLKTMEENFLAEDDNLIKTVSALQILALKPTEALFVQPLTPVEIIRSAILLRETVPFLEQTASSLRAELAKIAAKKQLIENKLGKIQKEKKLLQEKHRELGDLVRKKSKIRNSVEIKSEETKKEVLKLAEKAQDVRDLLNKIEAEKKERLRKEEERRKQEAVKRAKEQSKMLAEKKLLEQQRDSLIKSRPEIIKKTGVAFANAKGNLPMPAVGNVVAFYGEQKVKGVKNQGITIKTRNYAQVTAPFDGSVIFSGDFRGYGNLIIIEHGAGYVSLLAGLQEMDVEVGQMLLAGEPLGRMPSNGDAKLYMEIRQDGQPVNPLNWLNTRG